MTRWRKCDILVTVAVFVILFSASEGKPSSSNSKSLKTEADAKLYLEKLEGNYSKECNLEMVARWDYITNMTEENEAKANAAKNIFLKFQAGTQIQIIEQFNDYETYTDAEVKRQIQYLKIQGPANMSSTKVAEMNAIMSRMENHYATATVCPYGVDDPADPSCILKLDPDIEEKLSTVADYVDYAELAHYYTKWHDVISVNVTPEIYKSFIDLQNEMAKENDFNDMSEMWLAPYDDGSPEWTAAKFKEDMLKIWDGLKKNYLTLHAYVRMKLRKNPDYATHMNKDTGYLPANLMGNMWSQDWSALDTKTKPFPLEPSLDATAAMNDAGYDVEKMFKESEKFFTGLGLEPMTETFWEKSMIVRPDDAEVVCHASAEDFCLGKGNKDFRIKMCTKVTMGDLVTVHHEMGHIEYFQKYTNLSYIFRNGANPGFHEAIGDALALAVTTPNHLQCELELKMGLPIVCDADPAPMKPRADVPNMDINFLYITALQKFAFFPFAIAMDKWRWEAFEGKILPADYNKRWWELRKEMQGIEPPSNRSDTSFDPAAKYHIVANVPYIRYFASHILQFQFYEAMCIAAKKFDPNDPDSPPLYQCDFANSKEAGKLLGDMMELGFSKPWPEALRNITGEPQMKVDSLIRYFEPLFKMLEQELIKENEVPCLGEECAAWNYLSSEYEPEASKLCTASANAEWNYNVDLGNASLQEASTQANLAYAQFQFTQWNTRIKTIDYTNFTSDIIKRQLDVLNKIGTAALPQDKLSEYNTVLNEMSKIFGSAKVCPYNKQNCELETEGVNLDPELEERLSTSTDYDELTYVWKAWREATGRNSKMKDLYQKYVTLSNEAAVANDEKNMGDFWILRYESDTFREDMKAVWESVEPLYKKLYGYVRFRMSEVYPDHIKKDSDQPLPAHIFGNMWAQTWDNIYKHVIPYNGSQIFDITKKLVEEFPDNKEGATGMFVKANEFFTSLGLSDMSVSYGEKAMIRRPEGKEVICHASAWDFCDKTDYRIKMCTKINQEDFVTIHHELGHIQYDMNYKNLPITLREGANPGFHEAIGDVIALSVETPEHMKKIGYMDDIENTPNATINYLMKMALQKVAFLPFGYMIDAYRWQIFDGTIKPEKYNYNWLKMRAELQGVAPPVKRDEKDFDAGAKYHVPGNTPYIRYFVSFILQFQVHKALCDESGHEGSLHTCDIYGNTEAGLLFKQILESGSSRNWQDLLFDVTGNRTLDGSAITNYFKPLTDFFDEQQKIHGYSVTWNAGAFEEFYGDDSSSGDDNETAAIIVGIVLGVAVCIVVIGYFFKKKFIKS